MGFFNRDYRCFDGDSIDTAAMIEGAFDFSHDTNASFTSCSFDDSWSGCGSDDNWLTSTDDPWYGSDDH